MARDEIYPPYTPMSSLGHELGILFGFLAACIAIMVIYTVVWQRTPSLPSFSTVASLINVTYTVIQRKTASRDLARRKDLHAKGFHRDRAGIHEKMLDRYASPVHRAELPVDESDTIGVAVTASGAKALSIGFERTMSPLSSVSSAPGVKKGSGVMREVL